MTKFYLTTNTNRREPEALASVEYIHVKAKSDGSQTAIISEESIVSDDVQEMTQSELQNVLDGWVLDENEDPVFDIEGNPLMQSLIDLGRYL